MSTRHFNVCPIEFCAHPTLPLLLLLLPSSTPHTYPSITIQMVSSELTGQLHSSLVTGLLRTLHPGIQQLLLGPAWGCGRGVAWVDVERERIQAGTGSGLPWSLSRASDVNKGTYMYRGIHTEMSSVCVCVCVWGGGGGGGRKQDIGQRTPSSSEVSISSWSFRQRRSPSFIPEGASASSMRWVWSASGEGAGFASSSA